MGVTTVSEGKKMSATILWSVTGAGDLIQETVGTMDELVRTMELKVAVSLSKAAVQVLKWYKLTDKLNGISDNVYVEKDSNTPFIAGSLQVGKYDCLLVAPATANTVAKIVTGIADTLTTNAVAMANKVQVPVFILPVDRKRGTTTTILPNGKKMALTMRDVDIENSNRLQRMNGIHTLKTPGEIKGVIENLSSIKRDGPQNYL